jgi:UDP-N-acetylmuramyl tripeptide synthase
MRLRISVVAANLLARLLRFAGFNGQSLPGLILSKIYREVLAPLAENRTITIVAGTNGKTSTASMISKALSKIDSVAANNTGSNLERGAISALLKKSRFAVLEVDELYLSRVIALSKPKIVLLLNLSRDQLHRMHEVSRVAKNWHESFRISESTFVIDLDDPFLNYATRDSKRVIKVSFGGRRHPDASVCPSCGLYLKWNMGFYECKCGLSNKTSDYLFPDGSAGYRNSTLANIAIGLLGAPPLVMEDNALERSVTKEINGVRAEIRLAKNPASWTEALKGVDSEGVILILNARQVDGIDTSWLWDVSFDLIKGKKVVVSGERALDLSYRLHVDGIDCQVVENFNQATKEFEKGQKVNVLAAYTAFFGLAK